MKKYPPPLAIPHARQLRREMGFHALTGDRKGACAMTMTVTKNWRMTFTKVDDQTISIQRLHSASGNDKLSPVN